MKAKIVIACDSYKGCLSSAAVNNAAKEAILDLYPGCEVVCCPVADGGEGTVDAMCDALGAGMVSCTVSDPLLRPVRSEYAIKGDFAIIECASCIGLPLLAINERNPLRTSSRGLGEMILDALQRGCTQLFIGLGGSATCDGGKGMMSVPGLRRMAANAKFCVACDVKTPFVGEFGAARIFGPQKGASADEVEILESRMQDYAREIMRLTGTDVSSMPGAGAAGGLGGAFAAFFGATLTPGASFVLEKLNFTSIVDGADLVITGEGCSDSQTVMGKIPYGILKVCKERGIPVALLSGAIKDEAELKDAGFDRLCAVTPAQMPMPIAMDPAIAVKNIKVAIDNLLS